MKDTTCLPTRNFFLILAVLSFAGWSQPAQQPAQLPSIVKVEMPPTPPKGIRDLLRDFGPLIAASVAVGVWLNQRHLQKQHLKQNLFEKRWKVYAAIQDYLMALLSTGEMDLSSTYGQFRHDTDPGEVLFNKRAWEHITALGIAGMKYGPASRYEKPPV